jgi:putative transposase
MARPLRLHIPGVACHVFARGNAKQCLFEDEADHLRFLERLERSLKRFAVDCLAYCLQWNHYHLLLVPHEHAVSRVLQHLNSAYCQSFNRRHNRVGHVLQGRFGCRLVDDDSYLLAALRYIALNPVEAGLVARPEDWRWSSYRALAGLEEVPEFLAPDRVWRMVNASDPDSGRQRLESFVSAGNVGRDMMTALLCGGEKLAHAVDSMLQPHRKTIDFVYAERFATRPPLDRVFDGAVTRCQRQDAARVAFSEYAYTLSEIGRMADRPVTTIWSWIKHSESRRRTSPASPAPLRDQSGSPHQPTRQDLRSDPTSTVPAAPEGPGQTQAASNLDSSEQQNRD